MAIFSYWRCIKPIHPAHARSQTDGHTRTQFESLPQRRFESYFRYVWHWWSSHFNRVRSRRSFSSIGLHKTRLHLHAASHKHDYKSTRASNNLRPGCRQTAINSSQDPVCYETNHFYSETGFRVSPLTPFVVVIRLVKRPLTRVLRTPMLSNETKYRRMEQPHGPHSSRLHRVWKPPLQRNSIIIQYPSIRQSIHPSPFQVDSPKREREKNPISSGGRIRRCQYHFFPTPLTY